MRDVRNTQHPTADDAEPRLARERRRLDEARAEAAVEQLMADFLTDVAAQGEVLT